MKKRSLFLMRLAMVLLTGASVLLSGCEDSSDGGSDVNILELGPNIFDLGNGYYGAGILSDELEYLAAPEQAGRQRQANWCWAACIQMILNYHGISVSQEEIVTIVFGELVDQPGSAADIMYVIDDRVYMDIQGNYYYGVGDVIESPDETEFIDLLARRWPMIAGLQNESLGIGHAYLVTGVIFTLDEEGDPIIDRVIMRNPWPTVESREEITWADFNSRFMFGASLQLVPYTDTSRISARITVPVGHLLHDKRGNTAEPVM